MSDYPFGALLGTDMERLDYKVGRLNYTLYNVHVVGESELSLHVRATEIVGDGGQLVDRWIARWAVKEVFFA